MKILFMLLLALGCYANPTGSELKKTPSTAFDFTFQSPQNKIQESLQDMIKIEIGKETFLTRRNNNIFSCGSDSFGNTYCPSNLAKADSYWDSDRGSTTKYTKTIQDIKTTMDWDIGPTFKTQSGIRYFKASNNKTIAGATAICKAANARLPLYIETSAYDSKGIPSPSAYTWTSDTSTSASRTRHRAWLNDSIANIETYIGRTGLPALPTNNRADVICVTGFESQQIQKAPNGLYYFMLSSSLTFSQARNSCAAYGGGFRLPYASETTASSDSGVPSYGENTTSWTIDYERRRYGGCGPVPNTHWYGVYNTNAFSWAKVTIQCDGYHSTNIKYATVCVTPNKPEIPSICEEGYIIENGKCTKNIDYTYYVHKCKDEENNQGYNWEIQDAGGDCKPTAKEELLDLNFDGTGESCNSSTPPTNNCKRLGFTCNSNEMKPAFVDGEWKCSPFFCDGNMKCGYGTCDLPTTPSATKYQDIAYNPLGTVNDNKCNGDICDFVVNARVTYCESKQCPKGDDIIEKNGKCYKLECPAGTYLSGEKCIKVN